MVQSRWLEFKENLLNEGDLGYGGTPSQVQFNGYRRIEFHHINFEFHQEKQNSSWKELKWLVKFIVLSADGIGFCDSNVINVFWPQYPENNAKKDNLEVGLKLTVSCHAHLRGEKKQKNRPRKHWVKVKRVVVGIITAAGWMNVFQEDAVQKIPWRISQEGS